MITWKYENENFAVGHHYAGLELSPGATFHIDRTLMEYVAYIEAGRHLSDVGKAHTMAKAKELCEATIVKAGVRDYAEENASRMPIETNFTKSVSPEAKAMLDEWIAKTEVSK